MLEEGLASSINDALQQPMQLAYAIMDMRAFAAVKRAIDEGKEPDSGYVQDVFEFTGELMKQRQAQRKKHG